MWKTCDFDDHLTDSVNMPRVLQIVHCYRPRLLATPTNNQCISTVHAWVHIGKGRRSKTGLPVCIVFVSSASIECQYSISVYMYIVHVHVYVHIVYGGDTKKTRAL